MASVIKRPGSKFYWACWTGPDGKRFKKSTKLTNKGKALRVALDFEDAHQNRKAADAIQAIASAIIADLYGQSCATAGSYEDYSKRWLDRKEGEIADSTFVTYRKAVSDFAAFIGDKGGDRLDRIGKDDVVAFRDAEGKRVSARTANHSIKILRMLFTAAVEDGETNRNPAATVKPLKVGETTRRPFTRDELRALLRAVDGTEWSGMVLAGFYTGARLGDLAALCWDKIDLTAGEISIRTKKTGRFVSVPIADPLADHLATIEASDDPTAPVFPKIHAEYSKRNSTGGLSRDFGEIMRKAGLAAPGLSFHSLRHTTVSELRGAGVSSSVSGDLVGHDSAAVHRGYTHTEDADKRRAIAALPDISRNS